ncbi:MAG: DUF4122 domain-containing protein [Prevotellaceae bacterium]|jgi:hypothetical protein|nr:DUF4122 domain-containing protein [Prevotellaceae bacterium]
MEHLIYLSVKGVATVYLLHKIYRFLSGEQAMTLWRSILPEIKAIDPPATPQAQSEPVAYSVVGKSQSVYLEEFFKEEAKAVEPAFSEDLLQVSTYEEESDITNNDVADNLNEEAFSEEDRFLPLDTDADNEDFPSSTGMTYQQISEALDVMQGKPMDQAGQQAVARILHEIEGSDLFNFLTAQAENEAMVEKLLRENIDGGSILFSESTGKHKEIETFDMDKYV